MTPETRQEEQAAPAAGTRRQFLRFVALFVLIVLGLLIGYRFALNTAINDWYLFQVGRHTALVLGMVGERAVVETPPAGLRPAEVRATLDAWRRGQATPGVEDIARQSSAALRPWEYYQYRLGLNRRSARPGPLGPRVVFVWHEGLAARERTAALELEQARASGHTVDTLEAARTLEALRMERLQAPPGEAGRRADQGRSFTFIVVPECGAIEVMAIFFAAVAAFPTAWRKRLLGLGLGLPVLYGVNVFRLACLAMLGAWTGSGKWFDFAHEYVWQAVYVVFVVGLWLSWVEYVVRRRGT